MRLTTRRRRRLGTQIATVLLTVALLGPTAGVRAQDNGSSSEGSWPQWRGPLGTGSAPTGNPPLHWSTERNIRWKAAIPGRGSATPIVWGDRVFVFSAAATGGDGVSQGGLFARLKRRVLGSVSPGDVHQYVVTALARLDGRVLWQQVATEEAPHEGRHATGSWASPSGVADGEQVCAFFGSRGLFCYDLDGRLLWERDFGDMEIRMEFGEGASPALYGETIIINWDHQGQSFITALDKRTGEDRWRVDRDEVTSWSTPLIVEHAGGAQVVTSATNRVRSYDVATGQTVWESEGVTMNAIPTPVAADGVVYVTSGYRDNRLLAVRLADASGDITGTEAVVWSLDRDTPYVPSPLLHQGILYLLKSNSGVLSAFDAQTGARIYGPERLPGVRSVYASPVAVDDRIYIASREGTILAIKAGHDFEVLATNELEDEFDASPAIAGDELYLRGRGYLYCIAAR